MLFDGSDSETSPRYWPTSPAPLPLTSCGLKVTRGPCSGRRLGRRTSWRSAPGRGAVGRGASAVPRALCQAANCALAVVPPDPLPLTVKPTSEALTHSTVRGRGPRGPCALGLTPQGRARSRGAVRQPRLSPLRERPARTFSLRSPYADASRGRAYGCAYQWSGSAMTVRVQVGPMQRTHSPRSRATSARLASAVADGATGAAGPRWARTVRFYGRWTRSGGLARQSPTEEQSAAVGAVRAVALAAGAPLGVARPRGWPLTAAAGACCCRWPPPQASLRCTHRRRRAAWRSTRASPSARVRRIRPDSPDRPARHTDVGRRWTSAPSAPDDHGDLPCER
jgi:hypothetical protein